MKHIKNILLYVTTFLLTGSCIYMNAAFDQNTLQRMKAAVQNELNKINEQFKQKAHDTKEAIIQKITQLLKESGITMNEAQIMEMLKKQFGQFNVQNPLTEQQVNALINELQKQMQIDALAKQMVGHELKNLTINDPTSYKYIPYTSITPGQLRYSQLNVDEKVAAAKKKGYAVNEQGTWKYKFDDGNSTLETPLPVVLAPFGPVLVDGHHDTLANIALQAKTIPVYVVEDMSSLTPGAFWKQATDKGLVYPYTLDKKWSIPTKFSELKDDPNRFFAALVARKCVKNKQTGAMDATASPATPLANYPVWIKFGNDIPFVEFIISDRMSDNGIQYDNAWKYDVPEDFVERVRQVLLKNPIVGAKGQKLKIIKNRTLYTDIDGICIPEK